MAVNYPTSLDTLTNPTATDYLNSPSHAAQHANANDILEALEAKVGINSSAVTTSHDYKLSEVTGTDKAVGKSATQTLTNKTIDASLNTLLNVGGNIAAPNLLKNGNFINNSTNGYGSTPDDWTSSNANPVQGGIPALTKQNLIDGLGIADGDIEGLWPLNEASGNALDLSSNGYNLTDTNTVAASSGGLMASARDFEADNSEYFQIANASSPNLNINTSFTFFAYIKPETLGESVFLGKRQTGNEKTLKIFSTTQSPTILQTGLTPNLLTADVKMESGKWYFVVGIYSSSENKLKIWCNGIKKEVAVTGSPTASPTSEFTIGRLGDFSGQYFDGLIQNACVLSVALTDNQVKKLFSMTMYKGMKIRRATTDGYIYQDLPMNVVERLRGKTVALRADMYQGVAYTGQISILQTLASGSTDEKIISTTDATTGSWLEKVAIGTIEATATNIRVQLKHSTSDGNTWFRNVSLYEGSTLLPYDHSKDDWSRFSKALNMEFADKNLGYRIEGDMAFFAGALTTTELTRDGQVGYDTTNNRLYIREQGVVKYVAMT